MPRLTVMVAARDAATTIERAVRSALTALGKDGEVVVWSDGSADATLTIAESISDRRVKTFSGDTSVGSGEVRRRIMDSTDSEYVACLDADDVCMPWRFSVEHRVMERCDVVFSSAFKFGDAQRIPRLSRPSGIATCDAALALLFHNPFIHSTMYARRSVISEAGGYRPLRKAQDYELWLRVAANGGRMRRIAVPTIAYRLSPAQVSRQPSYIADLRRSATLHESYDNLLDVLTNRLGVNLCDPNWAAELCGKLSPLKRSYYSRLASTGKATFSWWSS